MSSNSNPISTTASPTLFFFKTHTSTVLLTLALNLVIDLF